MNMPIVIVISPQSKKDLQLPGRGNWGENLDYHHLQMDEVEINLFEVWKSIISDLWQQTEGTWLLFRGGGEKLVVWAFLLLSKFFTRENYSFELCLLSRFFTKSKRRGFPYPQQKTSPGDEDERRADQIDHGEDWGNSGRFRLLQVSVCQVMLHFIMVIFGSYRKL